MERNDEETVKLEKETVDQAILQTEQKTEKESSSKTFSILSLCFGILSLITCGFFLIPEILGIVFACCSKKHTKMSGMAKAGLICSIISVVMCIGFIAILGSNSSTSEPSNNTEAITETEDTEEITTTEVTTEETVPTMNESTTTEEPVQTRFLPQENLYYNESGELELFIIVEDVNPVNGTFTINISGKELGEPVDEYTITETMKPVENEDSVYISESGRFKMTVAELGLSLSMEDKGDSYLIDGDFVIYEEPKPEDNVITLNSISEIKDFIRDKNNVGKVVAINGGKVIATDNDAHLVDIREGVDTISITVYTDEILMYDDRINIVGYYSGIDRTGFMIIDAISVAIVN